MNRDHLIGFLSCLCLFLMIGATSQVNNRFKTDQELYNEITNLYSSFQPRKFRVETATPTIKSIPEREVVIFKSTTTNRIYTRLDDTLYSVALST